MNIDTINEQLALLENTKSEIKQTLINKGQDIDDSTPFSVYADEINNLIDTSDADATVSDIEIGKTAYVNGQKIEGILSLGTSIEANPTSATESGNYIKLATTMSEKIIMTQGSPVELGIRKDYLARDISLTADKIKQGETILGITGTYEGYVIKEYATETEMNEDILNISDGEIVKVINSGTITYYIKETSMKKVLGKIRPVFCLLKIFISLQKKTFPPDGKKPAR